MDEEVGRAGWWKSLPGVLTAVAALLTAVVGGVVALKQAGVIFSDDRHAPSSEVGSADKQHPRGITAAPSTTTAPAAPPHDSPSAIRLPGVTPEVEQVEVSSETYRILSATIERHNQDQLELHLVLRITNNADAATYIYMTGFRLLVDSVPLAPGDYWRETVQSEAAEEVKVDFVFPRMARSLVLRIISHEEDALIPLHLKS